jgi:hypothetical protein
MEKGKGKLHKKKQKKKDNRAFIKKVKNESNKLPDSSK